jgi:ATP-dependent helicase/nuclease subunit A
VRGLEPLPETGDQAHASLLEVCRMLDDFETLRDDPRALRRTVATATVASYSKGNQANWADRNDCRRVKAALKQIDADLQACRERLRSDATAALLRWLEGFVHYYTQKRQLEGTADFQDLLLWARDLVCDSIEVRHYFQAKYRCLLVDEFQDTDPLQVELIVYLCADGDDVTDWRTATLRPGSLFVVGDPKQSIYRFRRADIAMYDEVKAALFGGQPLAITQNFRSVAPIIEWVNRTFEQLIEEQPRIQPAYIALEPLHVPPPAEQEAVTLVRGVVDTSGGGGITEQRRAEADALASLILRDVGGGVWRVRDGAGGSRSAEYRDVVVLIPRRTELYLYEDAFARAGVPFRHEGGRSFFLRQEVRELVAVLRAVDDPSDAVAAVAALRSSAFGCSDEDLFLHRTGGGRFDYLRVDNAAEGHVADALRSLAAFAALRHETPLPDLVRSVLDGTRLVEFAMLQPQGEQVAANLLKVIDQARAFGDARGGGLRGFVRWLRENIARSADESDAAISEETDNVVRILTIYAAKGLQFPIVVFANMNAARGDRTSVIADRTGDGRLHVKLGATKLGFRTPGYDDAAAIENANAQAEEARLLYVAATRAQDRLVVPFFGPEDAGARDWGAKPPVTLNERLRYAGADEGDAIDAATLPQLDAETPVWQVLPPVAAPEEVDRIAAQRDEWRAGHQALVDDPSRMLRYATASALKPEWERPSVADGEVKRGLAAEFGSAVHALLERIDLARPNDAAAMSRTIAAEFGVIGQEAEIVRVARAALASNIMREALGPGAGRRLREAAFTVALPERDGVPVGIAEGRIDLLFEAGGEVVVVDFKTDAVSGAAIDERAEFYRTQALVYAWAAQRATGLPVREVVFIFARPDPVEERSFRATAAFLAEAEELLSRQLVSVE